MEITYFGFTNKPLKPVTGFVRMTGWIAVRSEPLFSGAPRSSLMGRP